MPYLSNYPIQIQYRLDYPWTAVDIEAHDRLAAADKAEAQAQAQASAGDSNSSSKAEK